MTVTETNLDYLELAALDADESFCHIKLIPMHDGVFLVHLPGEFICGQGFGLSHAAGVWKGEKTCPTCNLPICPDCLAKWPYFRRTYG